MEIVHQPPETGSQSSANLRISSTEALADLRYIRRCVEEAGSFTAVPGLGIILVGLSAVLVTALTWNLSFPTWEWVWLAESGVAAAIGVGFLLRKCRARGMALLSGPLRRFALSLLPPLVAGAAMTAALMTAGRQDLLPGTWLLLYGTAVVTGGAVSVRVVSAMGISFMLLGAMALAWSPGQESIFMGLGFGGLHLVYGLLIRRWHGG